jgi:hypothetical protein
MNKIYNFIDIVISDLSRYLKIAERSPNIKNKDVDLQIFEGKTNHKS